MARSSISELLSTKVYPQLDAVAAHLFEHLAPENQVDHYRVDCPACGAKKAAIYRAGNKLVVCDKCHKQLTVWDVVEARGHARRDVLRMLCEAAAVEFPTQAPQAKTVATPVRAPDSATHLRRMLGRILKEYLLRADDALHYLNVKRGWRRAEIERAPIGYYPSAREIADALETAGIDKQFIDQSHLLDAAYEQHIVGLWAQHNHQVSLWGVPVREGEGAAATTRYQEGAPRDVPCYYFLRGNKPETTLLVSEPLAAARLQANDINAAALGIGFLSVEQAQAIAAHPERNIVQWVTPEGRSRQAAETSILRANPLGVEIGLLEAPEGWGGAEEALSRVGASQVRTALEQATPGGVYLAARLATQLARHDEGRTYSKGRSWRSQLTGRVLDDFLAELSRRGIHLGHDVAEACRAMGLLLEFGHTIKEASEIVAGRFGVDLQISVLNRQDASMPPEQQNNRGNRT